MISASSIRLLQDSGASQSLINQAFNNPATYLILTPTQKDPLPQATPVQVFTSYQSIEAAFASNQIEPRTKAIIYDDEAWSFTPSEEQADPVHYAELASQVIHNHGLLFINTPALDLVKAPGGDKFGAFIQAGFLGAAKYADVFEIQLQGTEMTPDFVLFTQQAANQVRTINPNARLFVGLSTNPTGHSVTAEQLLNDYNATQSFVTGYWLNIPQGGKYCPSCGQAHPQVALQFLQGIK